MRGSVREQNDITGAHIERLSFNNEPRFATKNDMPGHNTGGLLRVVDIPAPGKTAVKINATCWSK
ncbi:Uncharacterised protein [Enterobacter hormaechei]|nr:Uncharacterised protein [Enterobacter hormaechei]